MTVTNRDQKNYFVIFFRRVILNVSSEYRRGNVFVRVENLRPVRVVGAAGVEHASVLK